MRWRAIPLVMRARLRREWAAMAVLALLFGLAGGAVLAALASAHRAETSYDRLLADIDAPDLIVSACDDQGCHTQELNEGLGAVAGVDALLPVRGLSRPVITTDDGRYLGTDPNVPCQTGDHELNVAVAPEGWSTGGDLPMRLHTGRAPRPGTLEVAVPRTTAARVGLASE